MEKDVIEGNKIIADYAAEKRPEVSKNHYYIHNVPFSGFLIENAQFHSSWDWLMPVVEKIEETNIVIINAESCEIKTMPFSIQIKDDVEKRYHRYENYIANPQSKILAVWECVVEFIKWYNKNK